MWLARDVRGLTLFSDRPVKQKIVIENEFNIEKTA